MKTTFLVIVIAGLLAAVAGAEIPPYCSIEVYDDFEDGNLDGWADACICSCSYSYGLEVIYSDADASHVLKHEGGVSTGGGNCEVYYPGLMMGDCAVEADFRNVEARHTTAKAMGLALRVHEATGVQYICWLTVSGDLYIYRTDGWTECGPDSEAHAVIDPIEEGQKFHLTFSAVGGELCVRVNGILKLTYVDPDPLPPGTAGVLATAGITYFDDIYIMNCDEPSSMQATTFGAIKAMYR